MHAHKSFSWNSLFLPLFLCFLCGCSITGSRWYLRDAYENCDSFDCYKKYITIPSSYWDDAIGSWTDGAYVQVLAHKKDFRDGSQRFKVGQARFFSNCILTFSIDKEGNIFDTILEGDCARESPRTKN